MFIATPCFLFAFRCKIGDDRINTYLTAFRENYDARQSQLVMFVLPNNKKERYDAIKKYTCCDSAGKETSFLKKFLCFFPSPSRNIYLIHFFSNMVKIYSYCDIEKMF